MKSSAGPRSAEECACADRCVRVKHQKLPCYGVNCSDGYTFAKCDQMRSNTERHTRRDMEKDDG